jgi:amidohydrolase
MGGEDMSLYLRKVPGCFAFLGAKNPDVGAVWPHHHPRFTIDESVLPYGVEILYKAAELYYSS